LNKNSKLAKFGGNEIELLDNNHIRELVVSLDIIFVDVLVVILNTEVSSEKEFFADDFFP